MCHSNDLLEDLKYQVSLRKNMGKIYKDLQKLGSSQQEPSNSGTSVSENRCHLESGHEIKDIAKELQGEKISSSTLAYRPLISSKMRMIRVQAGGSVGGSRSQCLPEPTGSYS